VNLGRVQAALDAGALSAAEPITAAALVKAGVLRRAHDGVRLLGGGELKAKASFEVHGASKPAIAAVEKLGGTVKVLYVRPEPPKPVEKPWQKKLQELAKQEAQPKEKKPDKKPEAKQEGKKQEPKKPPKKPTSEGGE
jgi:large subunit ribosomal protein L15